MARELLAEEYRRVTAMRTRELRTTLFDLVRHVQDIARTDEEVVAVLAHLVRSRRLRRPVRKISVATLR